jgi:hypothetical protein
MISLDDFTNSFERKNFQRCFEEVAGFCLSEAEEQPFEIFHNYIFYDGAILTWKAEKKNELWYQILMDGILGSVYSSFACVRYHENRAKNIENGVYDCFERSGVKEQMGNIFSGGGNTFALDFEYQAYILAYRRCLDYLSRALAAYFKNKHNSFRRLPKLLEKVKPYSVSSALSEVISSHLKNFEFVLSDKNESSLRDRIAHYEFVRAGILNFSARGVFFTAGGEGLPGADNPLPLHEILSSRSNNLFLCISQLLSVFVAEVKSYESSRQKDEGTGGIKFDHPSAASSLTKNASSNPF